VNMKASLLLLALFVGAALANSDLKQPRVLSPEERSALRVNCATGATGAAASAAEEAVERQKDAVEEEEQKRLDEESTKAKQRQQAGATGAASHQDEPSVPSESVEEPVQERQRPKAPPKGRSFVIMRMQLTGVTAEFLQAHEDKVRESIAAGFSAELGITADMVVIEQFEALEVIAGGGQAGETAFLELMNTPEVAAIRFRVEVDKDQAGVVYNEVKSMTEGGALQSNLAQHDINTQVALMGDPEIVTDEEDAPVGPGVPSGIVSGDEQSEDDSEIGTTGAAAGLSAPLTSMLMAAVAAAVAMRRM